MSSPDPRRPAAARPADDDDEISLLEILNLVLRHRYRIAAFAVALGLIGALVAVIRGGDYRASASFVPQTSSGQQGRLATLADQFGVNVPLGESASESPAFYAELLVSREILGPVARHRYEITGAGRGLDEGEVLRGTLPEILGFHRDDPELAVHEAVEWLTEDALDVETGRETGRVSFTVETRWAGLSFAIAERLLERVNLFNLQSRQSQAAAERQFIEERLSEAQDSLLAAEERLEAFLLANRQFENSPELRFRHDRLQRHVARNQQTVTSLDQAYEEARVSEVRNTPVITVVESPALPVEREPMGLLLNTVLGLVLGAMLGLGLAFARELLRREREEGTATYTEFDDLWKKTLDDLRTLGRRRS